MRLQTPLAGGFWAHGVCFLRARYPPRRFAAGSSRHYVKLGEPVGGGALHLGSGTGQRALCGVLWRKSLFDQRSWTVAAVVFVFQCVVFAGQLNAIASLVTVFYLLAYAAVDLACLALEWASAPNFRYEKFSSTRNRKETT